MFETVLVVTVKGYPRDAHAATRPPGRLRALRRVGLAESQPAGEAAAAGKAPASVVEKCMTFTFRFLVFHDSDLE